MAARKWCRLRDSNSEQCASPTAPPPRICRHFVYAPDGRVLGEYGTSANDPRAEFIWLSPEVGSGSAFGGDDGLGGYMPLAVAANDNPGSGSTTLYWVHANHMGVPALFTDASGTAIPPPSGYSAPGFPGQSRTTADLYYNRYRDYDPTTGRYIQADPIGLAGDSNPYLYAEANPLSNIDPDGLRTRMRPWGFPMPVPKGYGTEDGARRLGQELDNFGKWLCKHSLICQYFNPPRRAAAPSGDFCPVLYRSPYGSGGGGRFGGGGVPIPRKDDNPRDYCHKKCVSQTVGRGYLDASSRYRKCMRKCLASFDDFDY